MPDDEINQDGQQERSASTSEDAATRGIQDQALNADSNAAEKTIHIAEKKSFYNSPVPPARTAPKKPTTEDSKTSLDLQFCLDVVSKSLSEKQERVTEELETRANKPDKSFQAITNYRQATPCQSLWEKMSGTDRVRFCERCKLQVYDFQDVEKLEADEFIFQRESKRDVVLYRRNDGRFLIQDCPVGAARKRNLCLSVTGGCLILGAIILSLMIASKQQDHMPSVSSVSSIPPPQSELSVKQPAQTVTTSNTAADSQDLLRREKPKGIVVGLPKPPEEADLPPAPNLKIYSSSHNPRENAIATLEEMPQLPNLPKYTGIGTKVVSTNYHPYLSDGKQCYQEMVICREDSRQVLDWYRKQLEQAGWNIEANQSRSPVVAARRPEDGAIAFLHTAPSSGDGYRTEYVLRYILIPKAVVHK